MTNFEIQRYYLNEAGFNSVCSRNNLLKIKDRAYITNLDNYKPTGTHWIALHLDGDDVTYFDSFGFEYIQKN